MMRKLVSGGGVLALLTLGPGPVGAVDYIRGDVNSDGAVGISDGYALLGMLFGGLALPDCRDARDSNADGVVNITDAVMVLNHLYRGGQAPAEAAADGELGCAEYGTGSPLDDPQARLMVLSAESAGGTDGQATLIIGASHSTAIGGHSFDLHLPGDVFAGSQRGGIDLTDTFDGGFDGGIMDGDTFTHGLLLSFGGPARIPASDDVVPIYEIVVCLREGTAAGEYPINFTAAELADAASGRAIVPELIGGTLTVAADVTSTGDCTGHPNVDPDGPPREPPPPLKPAPPPFGPTNRAQNVSWRIDDADAAPGASIVLPFVVHSDGSFQGYSTSVDFDEDLLTATEIEVAWKIPGGDFEYGFGVFEFNNDNNTPGNGGVDEGFLIGAAVFSFDSEVSLPANKDVVALRYHFDVAPDAPDTTTQVRFLDGAQGRGQPVRNWAGSAGASVGIEFLESFVLVDCTLQIQAIVDITAFFLRGDANGDGNVDLSDAQHTLNYLFSGSQRPGCLDAADSNDDGRLDIADAINILQFLFLEEGPGTLPVPYPDEGEDPTPDGLGCSPITGVF